MNGEQSRDERAIKNEINKIWVNATIQQLEYIELIIKTYLGWEEEE